MHLPDLPSQAQVEDNVCSSIQARLSQRKNCDLHMDPDPRVQVELENLNTSTEFINKLELELEKARSEFNKLLCDSTQKIEALSKKLGSSINKARPYYETRITASELHHKAQTEALRYEQATEAHNRAKEVVHLAEQNLSCDDGDGGGGGPESATANSKLEVLLTRSAEKVNQSELERLSAKREHEITSKAYSHTEQRLSKLHKQLKRSIVKASLETRRNLLDLNNYANQHQLQLLPYFEMKAQFNQMLEEQICKISSYESRVNKAKANYTKALQRLEELNSKIYDTSACELSTTEEEYLPFSNSTASSSQASSAHNGAVSSTGENLSVGEFCPQHHQPAAVTALPKDDVVVESSEKDEEKVNSVSSINTATTPTPTTATTTATASTTDSRSAAVFAGSQVLDELLLEDNIESTLEQLKSQCLS